MQILRPLAEFWLVGWLICTIGLWGLLVRIKDKRTAARECLRLMLHYTYRWPLEGCLLFAYYHWLWSERVKADRRTP